GGVCGRAWGGGLARRRRHRRVQAREHREPRSGPRPQAPPAQGRDRLADRQGAREGPDADPDAALLEGRPREGRDRARARQGAARQAPRHRETRCRASDRARAPQPPVIEPWLAGWTEGWRNHYPDAIAALYTEDAVFVSHSF